MSALPAAEYRSPCPGISPAFDDGDDGPAFSWMDMALAYARVLHRVSNRGPLFAAAIDAAVVDVQKEN